MAKATKKEVASPRAKSLVWIGDGSEELGWVREKLAAQFPLLFLENDSQMEAFGPSVQPTHVILGSRSRSGIEEAWGKIERLWPQASVCLLMGAWWPGHRRSDPHPEDRRAYYWYEYWDRVLPWMKAESAEGEKSAASLNRVQRIVAESAWEPNRSSGTSVLIIADDVPCWESWNSLLRPLGCSSSGIFSQDPFPMGDFQWIIVDLLSMHHDRDSFKDTSEYLQRVAQRYPEARVIVRTNFPEFESWLELERVGAAVIVGSLFHLPGLALSLTDGLESQSLRIAQSS
ncbi:MAG: hypothetical protein U0905_14895 [Pirellulales bacterium]